MNRMQKLQAVLKNNGLTVEKIIPADKGTVMILNRAPTFPSRVAAELAPIDKGSDFSFEGNELRIREY